jgi:hypothetical protein
MYEEINSPFKNIEAETNLPPQLRGSSSCFKLSNRVDCFLKPACRLNPHLYQPGANLLIDQKPLSHLATSRVAGAQE